MRDAVELEWAGIPAVAIVHETMATTAEAMGQVSGMPDAAFITLPYPHVPLAGWTEDEVRQVAADVLDAVCRRLTRSAG